MPKDTTWENFSSFNQLYQNYHLEDKVQFDGEASVAKLDLSLEAIEWIEWVENMDYNKGVRQTQMKQAQKGKI